MNVSAPIITKLHLDGKKIASQATESAMSFSRFVIDEVKKDSPEFISRFSKKGEAEWGAASEIVARIINQYKNKFDNFNTDIEFGLKEIKNEVNSRFFFDTKQFDEIIENLQEKFFYLPVIPKLVNPISNYDELSIRQIREKLLKLTHFQIKFLISYERKNSNRVSLIKELEKRLKKIK